MNVLRTCATNHRLALITLVVLGGVLALFVWTAGSWAQSPIPHAGPEAHEEPGEFQDCLACHQAGVNGAGRLASDHIGRGNEDCLICHEYTGALPSLIPHVVEGQEGCLACHETGIGIAGPLAGDHVDYEDKQCLDCHFVSPDLPTPMPVLPTPTPEPVSVEGTAVPADCAACHQSIPADVLHANIAGQALDDAAAGEALYAENCASCHGESGERAVEMAVGKELVLNSVQYLGQQDDAAIIVRIAAGRNLMPGFGPDAGGPLSWDEVRAVTAFMRVWASRTVPVSTGGDVSNGAEVYARYCATCHGSKGQGGMAAPEPINTSEYLAGVTDDVLRQVTLEGTTGMPGFAAELSDEELNDLIALMRSWQP